MKRNFNLLRSALKKVFRSIIRWLDDNKSTLLYLLGVVLLECVAILDVNVYAKAIMILVICFILYVCILVCLEAMREQINIPIWHKQLTHKSSEGFVYIDKEDQEQAIIYLHAIEQYIKNNSLR